MHVGSDNLFLGLIDSRKLYDISFLHPKSFKLMTDDVICGLCFFVFGTAQHMVGWPFAYTFFCPARYLQMEIYLEIWM